MSILLIVVSSDLAGCMTYLSKKLFLHKYLEFII